MTIISELFKIEIGNLAQWLSLQTNDATKPVLLLLHGGPGTPCMSLFRKLNSRLRDHFLLATWDQRGTGRSYSNDVPEESMTMEQFVQDTLEITLYLKKRFNREKIFILGHSWGATVALQVIHRFPEHYYAYFAVSQFVHAERNEQECYDFTMRMAVSNHDKRSIAKLNTIGRPVNGFYEGGVKHTLMQKSIVSKYKGDFHKKGSTLGLLLSLAVSREYGYWRLPQAIKGIPYSLEKLGKELHGINYFITIPEIEIPIYFFTGKHDYLTPHGIQMEYFNYIAAPTKTLVLFEHSAHSPLWEEADKFNEIVIQLAEKCLYPGAGIIRTVPT